MDSLGVRFPDIVHAQGILETGWFNKNNPILMENNNWLGIKCAQYRRTYCIGTRYGHAIFESKLYCLLDYLEWQKKYIPVYESKFGIIDNEEDYYNFLLKWQYAEDKHYINKLRRIKNLLKSVE
jgi:flagellum-specific peptidoglycan hydrolase FlgJ